MNTTVAAGNGSMGFAPARRVNRSLTASMEKRILCWMAERAPRWVTSDQLTVLGLSAQIGAGVFYALSRYNRYALVVVIACLVLNWLGDSLDGTLARVRRQERKAPHTCRRSSTRRIRITAISVFSLPRTDAGAS